jgi:hypothetical protein
MAFAADAASLSKGITVTDASGQRIATTQVTRFRTTRIVLAGATGNARVAIRFPALDISGALVHAVTHQTIKRVKFLIALTDALGKRTSIPLRLKVR